MGAFNDKVFEVVRRIPRGKVATYGQVARLVGAPRKARFVGYAMRANPKPGNGEAAVPCHRVVFKDGAICEGYAFGGPEAQRSLLEAEGVSFTDETHVDLDVCLWDGRATETPAGDAAHLGEVPLGPPEDFDWEAELAEEV